MLVRFISGAPELEAPRMPSSRLRFSKPWIQLPLVEPASASAPPGVPALPLTRKQEAIIMIARILRMGAQSRRAVAPDSAASHVAPTGCEVLRLAVIPSSKPSLPPATPAR